MKLIIEQERNLSTIQTISFIDFSLAISNFLIGRCGLLFLHWFLILYLTSRLSFHPGHGRLLLLVLPNFIGLVRNLCKIFLLVIIIFGDLNWSLFYLHSIFNWVLLWKRFIFVSFVVDLLFLSFHVDILCLIILNILLNQRI